jgi:hypothetical protein
MMNIYMMMNEMIYDDDNEWYIWMMNDIYDEMIYNDDDDERMNE